MLRHGRMAGEEVSDGAPEHSLDTTENLDASGAHGSIATLVALLCTLGGAPCDEMSKQETSNLQTNRPSILQMCVCVLIRDQTRHPDRPTTAVSASPLRY